MNKLKQILHEIREEISSIQTFDVWDWFRLVALIISIGALIAIWITKEVR